MHNNDRGGHYTRGEFEDGRYRENSVDVAPFSHDGSLSSSPPQPSYRRGYNDNSRSHRRPPPSVVCLAQYHTPRFGHLDGELGTVVDSNTRIACRLIPLTDIANPSYMK